MNAQETDRQASLDKFIASLGQHTLDDVVGKAPLSVAQTLRSDRVAERWHLELLKLKGNTPPKSEFGAKVETRIREADSLCKAVRRKQHAKLVEERQAQRIGKKDASPVNMAQMTAGIVQAQIIAGAQPDVAGALKTVVDIINQVHDLIEGADPRKELKDG